MKRFLSGLCGMVCLLLLSGPPAPAQTITTVVGTGTADSTGDGAAAINATLNVPHRVATDAAGNLYIAERAGHRIRRVDAATGDITTVAGTGTAGFSGDGTAATGAQLDSPSDVVVDPATGDLIIADTGNHRIRRVDVATGDITTVAGDGTPGNGGDTGPGPAAQLNGPSGVVVLANGDVLITDENNHRVRCLLAVSGDLVAFAGAAAGVAGFSGDGGPGLLAQMRQPRGITRDAAGNIFIADAGNHRVRRMSAGTITTVAGNGTAGFSGDGAAATAAQLNFPHGLALHPDGSLLIADSTNNRIRLVILGGNISTFAGTGAVGATGDGGPATAAQLSVPIGLAFDSSTNLFLADRDNHKIRRVAPAPTGTPPVITTQPQSAALIAGGSVSLNVTASGAPSPAFQWFFTNGPIPGATAPTLTFNPAQVTNSGSYFVVVTNSAGSVTSTVVTLTITNSTAPPTITAQPSSQTIVLSNNVTFTVSATGALPLAYQWFFNSNAIGGATASSYTLNNVQAGAAGDYFVVITNNFGSLTSSLATLTVVTNSQPPPLQWAVTGGSVNDEFISAVAADPAGNSYVGATMRGTTVFGGVSLTVVAQADALFAKLDPLGSVLWARRIGESGTERGLGVAVDSAGNVFGCGRYESAVLVNGTNINSTGGGGGDDIFLVKYNSNGTALWGVAAGGNGDDVANAVTADAAGNAYVVGDFMGTAKFSPTTTLTNLGAGGVLNSFVVKYTPAGAFAWVVSFGGTQDSSAKAVAADAAGNIYVGGNYRGTIQFGTNTLTSAGSSDAFLAKLDPGGNVLWVQTFGGTGGDGIRGVKVSPGGGVYVSGTFQSVVVIGGDTLTSPSNIDAFTAKFSGAGSPVWARQSTGGRAQAFALALDGGENVFIAGQVSGGNANFGGTILTNAGGTDGFVTKYDAAGNLQWARRAGSAADESFVGVAADAAGNAFAGGSILANTSFDGLPLTTAGLSDMVIVKFRANNSALPLPPGLVGWWAGDGNTFDYVSTNHALSANLAFGVGKVQQALDHNGSNNVFRVPSAPALNVGVGAGFTAELWLNLRDLQNPQPLVEWHDLTGFVPPGFSPGLAGVRSHLWVNFANGVPPPPGALYVNLISTTGASHIFTTPSNVVQSLVWQHIALTYTRASGTASIYVNGNLVVTTNLPAGTSIATAEDLLSGYRPTGLTTGSFLNGLLDELSLYNRALTATEIQALVAAGSAGKAPPAAPTILAQPQALTVDQGAPAVIGVAAAGFAPLAYQWRFNGTNVPGQTNATLAIPAAYSVHEGSYDVRITQLDGASVLSLPAMLNVLGQGEMKTLFGTTNDVVNFAKAGGNVFLPAGAVSWWGADNNTLDLVSSNHGSLQNGAGFTAGQVRQAFNFNGVNANVTIADSQSLRFTGAFSVELWMRSPGYQNNLAALITKGDDSWRLQRDFTGRSVLFSISGVTHAPLPGFNSIDLPATNVIVDDGNWHHVAAVYSGSTKSIYIDGVQAISVPCTGTPAVSSFPVMIGQNSQTGGRAFNGQLDEVTLYNRALTPGEVQSIFTAGSSGKINPTVPWTLTSTNTLLVVPGTGNIQSTQSFGDFILHAEFLLPASGNGNCGIYLQGRYEVQIFNSFGKVVLDNNDCGAIWGQIVPATNACLAPGVWQTYDIIFHQAQWNGNTKVADARATVVLNGVTVQDNVAITGRTTGGANEGPSPGPVTLQDNGTSVQFRNLRITPLDVPPEFNRAQSAGGTLDDSLNYQTLDAAGNTFLAGSFQGTTTIGTNVLVSAGLYDAYLAKLNAAGNVLWVRQVGGTGDESGFGVAPAPNGDVLFCGRFHNTASFGSTNLTASGQDIFLARYDGTGNLLWARKAGGTGTDAAYAVATDGAGNAYLTGNFDGTADFGGTQLISGSGQNSFVAKYGPTGSLIWAFRLGGTGTADTRRIQLDPATNVYVGGLFSGAVQFVTAPLTSAGQNDGFALKLDSGGAVQWLTQFGGGNDDEVRAVMPAPDGTVGVAGSFRNTITIGTNTLSTAGGIDGFVAKLDAAGTPLWARKLGGSGTDIVHALALDPYGGYVAVGSFNASATFNATTLATSGSTDFFLVKYDATGAQQWVRANGNGQTIGGLEVQVDAAGNPVVSGAFSGTLPLDHLSVTSAGQADYFLGRLTNSTPVISQQPIGGNVLAGQNATFSVVATGTGALTYQWRLNGTNLAGATNAAYTIVNASTNAAGIYDVLVTHAFGIIASTPAVVTVTPSTNPLNYEWVARAGSSLTGGNGDFGKGITLGSSGDVFVTGQFNGTASFGTTNLSTASGSFTDIYLAKYSSSGVVQRVSQIAGMWDDSSFAVQEDAAGNLYVGGRYDTTGILGFPGLVNSGGFDGILAKFDPSGSLLWIRQFGASNAPPPGLEHAYALALDPAGNPVITGTVFANANFGSTNLVLAGTQDGFLAKYDTNGTLQWARPIGSTAFGEGRGLASDAAGNLYVSGFFTGSILSNGVPIASAGSSDVFVAKFSSTGGLIWLRTAGGAGADQAEDLSLDPQGNVVITGTFAATATFGATTLTSAGGADVFVAKYDNAGNLLWARSGGGTGDENSFGADLTTDRVGNVYVTGAFQGTAQFGSTTLTSAGSDDVFVAKYSPAGSLLWSHQFGGTGFDHARGIAVDGSGSVFLTGAFDNTVAAGTNVLTSAGGHDAFVFKLAAVPPVITAQPASQNIGVTQPVTFSVGVTGTLPFTYQWRFNGTNLPGATNAAFTIASVTPANAGGYSVLVGDALGLAASSNATLAVDTSGVPFITTQPQNLNVLQGDAILLSVAAVGAQPLAYQWRRNGTNLAGENFAFLVLPSTTNSSATYAVVITNVFGALTSAPAVVTVTPVFPPVVTNQPASLTVVAGQNATFTVAASGTPPFNYQWVRGGVALPGNDAPTLTITNATLADAGSYFVQVFNAAGVAASTAATLTVNVPPQLLSVPQPATVLQGATTNFTAAASGSPAPAFAWFRDGVRLTNSAGYSGSSTTNLIVLGAQGGQAGSYVVVATNVAGAVTSAPVTLTVLLAPVITAHPTNVTLTRTNYTNALPVTLSVTATGAAPLLYQWRFNGADVPGETNTTFTLTNVTRLQNGVYQVAVSNLVGVAPSSNALVRVRVAQRLAPPAFTPGQPFRLRFLDDNGEQASPVDLTKIEVQATTILTGPGALWVRLTNGFSVVNGMLQLDDPAGTNALRRYYRVIEK